PSAAHRPHYQPNSVRTLGAGQPPEHQPAHGDVQQRLAHLAQPLVVLAKAPALAAPRKRALHHPPPRKDAAEAGPLGRQPAPLEWSRVASHPEWDPFAARLGWVLHHLDGPAQLTLDPRLPAARVALVNPDVAQPWELLRHPSQQEWDRGAVLELGAVD